MKKGKTSIMPLGDRVLVRPFSEDEKSKKSPSGIIIPDTVEKERSGEGEVIAVGPGKRGDDGKIIPMEVKKGDHILFSKYGYEEVKMEEEEYYIINESSILAVVK
ncbi:MAG: co-chaperone GroES [Candidatus Paceibacterota bacterium]